MIGVVTDSTAQLPAAIEGRDDVRVVPVHVAVDGVEFLDGVDLDRSWFHRQLAAGAEVTTSLPSPGEFAAAFDELAAAGADSIVSIHVGSSMSGTVNAARLGAELADVRVEVIDTGLASFGIACCVLEAVRVIDGDRPFDAVAEHVRSLIPRVYTSFLIQATEFVRSGGRSPVVLPDGHDGVAVFGGCGADIAVVGSGSTVEGLASAMVEELLRPSGSLVVAISEADPSTVAFTDEMERLLHQVPRVAEIIRYQVNPSVLAYSGLGTAGGYSFAR